MKYPQNYIPAETEHNYIPIQKLSTRRYRTTISYLNLRFVLPQCTDAINGN